jgi:hypothetical protein
MDIHLFCFLVDVFLALAAVGESLRRLEGADLDLLAFRGEGLDLDVFAFFREGGADRRLRGLVSFPILLLRRESRVYLRSCTSCRQIGHFVSRFSNNFP